MKQKARRSGVAIVGAFVVAIGAIAIPYPGPGWLIVFAGLAILATEFEWAQRVLDYARGKYNKWQLWMSRQSVAVKILFWLLTFFITITTIYLLNGYGIVNDFFQLPFYWVNSPLPIFN
jgi:uncharacterized protein (TIGR02611 family)